CAKGETATPYYGLDSW
nr:immunoglobulin heavy chain junction region [Macaca mulatta]MOX62471.1 immunoglobulin heavy chain junction region [Macaca mulatta]MOX62577.1 immunoglobulin heavy chain junction region [Macaca mulatta]MOX62879.1 immunoglobulin heavy chain junction region [Macaca mulatta]MOX63784.1 immunoglobulin heavy chain junction region [Macaca mulatta]